MSLIAITLKTLRMLNEAGLLDTDESFTREEKIHEYAEQLMTDNCASLHRFVSDTHIDIAEYIEHNFNFQPITSEKEHEQMINEWMYDGHLDGWEDDAYDIYSGLVR